MEGKEMGLSVGEETRFGMNHAAGAEGETEKCYLVHQRPAQGQAMGIHGDPNVSTPQHGLAGPHRL